MVSVTTTQRSHCITNTAHVTEEAVGGTSPTSTPLQWKWTNDTRHTRWTSQASGWVKEDRVQTLWSTDIQLKTLAKRNERVWAVFSGRKLERRAEKWRPYKSEPFGEREGRCDGRGGDGGWRSACHVLIFQWIVVMQVLAVLNILYNIFVYYISTPTPNFWKG